MKFVLMVNETAEELAKRLDPEKVGPYMAPYSAYWEALSAAGVVAGGNMVEHPKDAATVRIRGGERQIHDGPFADTKEQLGGWFIIDVPDMQTALEWAAKCPSAATGSVEVRPVSPDPEQ